MADVIRHARAVSPWFIPQQGGIARDFHGVTDVGVDVSVSSEKVYVMGKKAKCGTDKDTPESTVPLTQFERGEVGTYLTLANLVTEPVGGFNLLSFNNSLVDAIYYVKDEFNGVIDASVWMPKLAVNSFTLNADDPQGKITREIELGGDDERVFTGANKYLIHKQNTAPSGTSGAYSIPTTDPLPVVNPHVPGEFIFRVDRTRAGVTTTLTVTTDYTYDTINNEVDIVSALSADVYNIYFSAGSFGTPGDPTTVDTADPCFLKTENVTVLIKDGTTEIEMTHLSSITISATLNRIDENVIGNDERILRDISDTPVTVDLSGRIKNYFGEKAFMNSLASGDLASSVKSYKDNIRVTLKIYTNATKTTFLIGYQVANLSFSDGNISFTANEFGTADLSAESDDIKITTTEADLV